MYWWIKEEFFSAIDEGDSNRVGEMLLLLAEKVIRKNGSTRFGIPFDELQQECVLMGWQSLSRFDRSRGTSIFSYLTQVMHRTCFHLTKKNSRKTVPGLDDLENIGEMEAAEREDFDTSELLALFSDEPVIVDFLQNHQEYKNLKQYLCRHQPQKKRRRLNAIYRERIAAHGSL